MSLHVADNRADERLFLTQNQKTPSHFSLDIDWHKVVADPLQFLSYRDEENDPESAYHELVMCLQGSAEEKIKQTVFSKGALSGEAPREVMHCVPAAIHEKNEAFLNTEKKADYASFLSALSSLQELCYASKVYDGLSVRRNQLDALKQAFVAPAQNKDIIDLFHRKWIRKRDTAIENKQDMKAKQLTHMITLLQQGRNMQASEGDKQQAIDELKAVITDKILKISHKVERLADYLDIAPLQGETLSVSMSEQLENKIGSQRQLVAQYYDTLLCPVTTRVYEP